MSKSRKLVEILSAEEREKMRVSVKKLDNGNFLILRDGAEPSEVTLVGHALKLVQDNPRTGFRKGETIVHIQPRQGTVQALSALPAGEVYKLPAPGPRANP